MATDRSAATVKPAKDRVKPAAASRPGNAGSGNGMVPRAKKYLGEVGTELRKTTWPTRQELITQTQVVIGLLIVIGVFISAWDWILSQIFAGIFAVLGIKP
jgi:preprotein translocase subunit SecE